MKRLKNKFSLGFTIYELMMAVGIASVFVAIFGAVMVSTSRMQSLGMSRSQIDLFRRELIRVVNDNDSWAATVGGSLNSSTMTCLRNNTPCTVGGGPGGSPLSEQIMAVYNKNGTVFFDGTQPSAGLTYQGAFCNSFSTAGNDQCPFRAVLRWTAICSPGSCTRPLLKITAAFSFQPKSPNPAINPADYNVTIYRAPLTPAGVPPVCSPLTHVSNNRNFNVAWSAGSNNGGPGSCTIEYQRRDTSWRPVASPTSVDCDSDGSLVGPVTLPPDGWLGGAWASPVSVRLVRNSDNAEICNLGSLTCSAVAGSSVPTPNVDENCNNGWDDSTNTPSYINHPLGSMALGAAYSCPDIPGASFISVEMVSNDLEFTEYRMNQDCTGAYTFRSPYLIHRLSQKSGTLPGPGPFEFGVMSTANFSPTLFDGSTTACQFNTHVNWSYQLSAPITQWQRVTCDYRSGGTFSFF